MSEVPLYGWLVVAPLPGGSSSLLLSCLELSDKTVYAPYIRARLGTASHFCEVVVLCRWLASERFLTCDLDDFPRESNRPSGWLLAVRALTSRLIFLTGVQWSCLRINKPAPPPFAKVSSGAWAPLHFFNSFSGTSTWKEPLEVRPQSPLSRTGVPRS